jgi:hypothetical protein
MKFLQNIMKTSKITSVLLVLFVVGFWGCDLVDPNRIDDPNNPSVSEVLSNVNQAQLQNLVSGLEVRHRNSAAGAMDFIASFGREVYPMYASDPRFMGQWLGLSADADAETDPSFYSNAQVWTTPYLAVKQANILIESVNNTDNISEQQKNGYLGVAKTFKAFQYLIPLVTQSEENGIRIDVNDPLNPGPFESYDEALTQIRSLLNEAQTDLQNAGTDFNFELTAGLSSFNTPSTFINLNRAIDARAAIYGEDWDGALQSLQDAQPFFELAQGEAVMNKGAEFVYTGPPDAFNPYFYPENAATNQIVMVHPSMIDDAETGDERVANKFFQRNNPVTVGGKSATYQDDRFESNTDPFPWLRNEELILIYAEAKAQRDEGTDLADAVDAINFIRNTWGLGDFVSGNQNDIIDQVLFERRYSLWGEFGHRWIDAKRYDRLNQLPADGGTIYGFIARPLSEINWEEFNS